MSRRPPLLARLRPVPALGGGTYIAAVAVLAALTIGGTRIYLRLAGYPSIGGTTYHLAHALWGGLALTVASVLLLSLAGRWVRPVSAVLAGVGLGLFVDEVGKFITRANDYFFPLAAPIAYLCLVFLAAAAVGVGRTARSTPQSHLHAALDLSRGLIDGRLTVTEQQTLRAHLAGARAPGATQSQRALADGLLVTLDAAGEAGDPGPMVRLRQRGSALLERWVPDRRLRWISRAVLAIGTLDTFAIGVLSMLLGGFGVARAGGVRIEGEGLVGPVPSLFLVIAGATALWACWLMARGLVRCLRGRPAAGARSGIAALVILLVAVNVPSSYVNQFTTLLHASLQGLGIGVLALLLRRAERQEDPAA